MGTENNGQWYSITSSLQKLNVSRRTLYDRINRDELITKKEGRNRLVWLDDTVEVDTNTYTKQNGNIVKELKSQLEYFKTKVQDLELRITEQNQELSENRQRTDTIILKMTDQNQLLLDSRKPFWKFW